MKKLLMICLLAGCSHSFAQNVGVKELVRIMEAPSVEWVNQYLAPLGYLAEENKGAGNEWSFKTDKNPDAPTIAELYRIADTAGIKLVYETSNPFFYTNILNQMPINNFLFRQTTTAGNNVNLIFSNGKYELLLEFVQDTHLDKPYTLTLRPINTQQSTTNQPRVKMNQQWLTPRYDHRN